jgi:hypothetical protein
MWFDAFGRFTFGQIGQQASSTAVLVGAPGAYLITGTATPLRTVGVFAGGTYAITGSAVGFRNFLPASAGSYAISGGAAILAGGLSAAAGSYSIAGQSPGGKSSFAAASGSYSISGRVAPLRVSLAALSGAYTIAGGSSLLPGSMVAAGGAYVVTLGDTRLRRTGGEYDQVYGGIGHYLEAIERARQLATITRKTPAPIVHDIRPWPQPSAPVAPPQPAADIQAIEAKTMTAQRMAEQQAQRAGILKQRRRDVEILLLAS